MPSLEPNFTKESLENRIGLYWLHRIGIASLVLGFVFLILCSFQYFAPILKLTIGWIASVALIAMGERLASQKKQAWYGQGLVGGGWSLAYFTTYAACYVPSVQVIDSLPWATMLLIAVASGSLFSALRANSELMAIFSIGLAGLSILIGGHSSLVADIPFVIIACSSSFLGSRKNWNKLLAFALATCYIGHLYSTNTNVDDSGRVLIISYLSILWLTFTSGIGFSSNTSVNTSRFRIVLASLNTAAFCFCLDLVAKQFSVQAEEILLAAAGAVYLGIGRWLRQRNMEEMSTAHTLLGLVLVNGAKAMRYSGVTAVTLDVMQIALLSTIGRRYGIPAFRWFAAILTLLLFPFWLFGQASWHGEVVLGIHSINYFKIGLVATLTLAAIAFEFRSKVSIVQNRSWCFYNVCANLMFALLLGQLVSPCWQALLISLQAVANHFIYVRMKHGLPCLIGAFALLSAIAVALGNIASWTVAPMLLLVAALVIGYFETRKHGGLYNSDFLVLNCVYALSASVMLALLTWQKAPAAYVSLDLGLEAISLLVGGFTLKDRSLRTYGLAILALVAGKLLCIDAAHYNTIERVTSFIAAGAVFLLSSFAYTKFTGTSMDGSNAKAEAFLPEEDVGLQSVHTA